MDRSRNPQGELVFAGLLNTKVVVNFLQKLAHVDKERYQLQVQLQQQKRHTVQRQPGPVPAPPSPSRKQAPGAPGAPGAKGQAGASSSGAHQPKAEDGTSADEKPADLVWRPSPLSFFHAPRALALAQLPLRSCPCCLLQWEEERVVPAWCFTILSCSAEDSSPFPVLSRLLLLSQRGWGMCWCAEQVPSRPRGCPVDEEPAEGGAKEEEFGTVWERKLLDLLYSLCADSTKYVSWLEC